MGLDGTKRRTLKFPFQGYHTKLWGSTGLPPQLVGPIDEKKIPIDIIGAQTTVSRNTGFPAARRILRKSEENHIALAPNIRRILEDTDWGSNFLTTKNSFSGGSAEYTSYRRIGSPTAGYTRAHYFNGRMLPTTSPNSPTNVLWPTLTPADVLTMNIAGTTAISRTLPNNPVFDAATALGELREGLPHVPFAKMVKKNHSALNSVKGSGDEYLNLAFGWLPLLSDIQTFASTVIKSHDLIKSYEDGAGKHIYRRYDFPDVTSTEIRSVKTGVPPSPTGHPELYITSTGTETTVRRTTTKMWFSACYTYALLPGDSQRERLLRDYQIARKLYGFEPNWGTVWNLIPFSWAADWFANTGDMVNNLVNIGKDGLVIRWAYIMRHDVIEDTHVHSGVNFVDNGNTGPITAKYSTESKRRVKATPYGFGLNWKDFSPKQLAILAALGITRIPS